MTDDRFIPPVVPFRGVRSLDAWGGGGFGAPRGDRKHPGIDLIALPGDHVVMPGPGRIDRIGLAYPGSNLRFVHISSPQWHARILYVQPLESRMHEDLPRGTRIGVAQDVAGYYFNLDPKRGPITNHVHFEMFTLADPTSLIDFPPTPGVPA